MPVVILDQRRCNCQYCFCPKMNDGTGYYCDECFTIGYHPGPLRPGGQDTSGYEQVIGKISVSIIKRDD